MEYIISFMESWGYVALFIGMVLENANIPIPSEIILGFAGYLVAKGVFTFTPAVAVAVVAGVAGSVLSYWMGEYGGRPFLLRFGKHFHFSASKFRMAEELFNHHGGKAVFFARLLPAVRTFISFPAGVAKYPMWRFLLWTALGTLPWTALIIRLGQMLGERWQEITNYNNEFVMVTGVIFVIVGIYFLWRYKKKKK